MNRPNPVEPNGCAKICPAQMPQEGRKSTETYQDTRPNRRRRCYPTRMAAGPFRLVTFRHRRGYAILDDRSGAIAYTEAHPVSGRPIPAMEPDARRALRIAADLATD